MGVSSEVLFVLLLLQKTSDKLSDNFFGFKFSNNSEAFDAFNEDEDDESAMLLADDLFRC
jgi:hypothetical protein